MKFQQTKGRNLAIITTDKNALIKTPKPLIYKAKRQTPATAHQKERLREYREAHNITDPINWETLTRNEASRMYDNYRKNE